MITIKNFTRPFTRGNELSMSIPHFINGSEEAIVYNS